MRVYVDGDVFRWQGIGGISRVFIEILPRIARKDNDVNLTVAIQGEVRPEVRKILHPWYDQIPSVPVYWRPWRFWNIVRPVIDRFLWYWYWRSRDCDVFLSTYYTLPPIKAPSVCVVHDMILELFHGSFDKVFVTEMIERQRRAIAAADRLICVSDRTKQDVIHIHRVAENICRVVNNAAGTLKNVVGEKQASKMLLYVGDFISKYKNVDFLARCLGSREFSEFREYNLMIVSSRRPDSADRSRLSELMPGERLTFVTACSDDDLAHMYLTCSAFIYPSLYEGFGIPILEALSYGTPVVSSTGGALAEVGGDAVYYFDPKSKEGFREALSKALSAGRKPSLVAARKEHARRFSWDKAAEMYVSVLREVSGRGQREG
jgi:glycosyltransferase involved in cell wall biosynthesis